MKIAGIMTGTSLDGIDIVISDFSGNVSSGFQKNLLAYRTYPFKNSTLKAIQKILNEDFYAFEISQLNFVLAKLFYKHLLELCDENSISISDLEAVGVHGQTIWHQPFAKRFAGEITGSSLQIFSGTAFNAISGIKTIYDFRSGDIALGGQGAPLVPIYDYYFLKRKDIDVTTLNIGGIANLTYLPKNCTKQKVVAFDSGPGNVLLDMAVNKYYGLRYDENGNIAESGEIISDLMHKLLQIDYIYLRPPKSTGREMFNPILLDNILSKDYKPQDVVSTFTEFTAFSITENIRRFTSCDSEIIVTGGGAKNKNLIRRIKDNLNNAKIKLGDDVGINEDSKEAECFAFLAYLNINRIPANLPAVTGASREIILGSVAG